ncbi:WD40 repeat domain-containing serine/threonine protein kinase [Yinghuangia seranimata]|uniref:WD40 repeat domain-containing serine/threonine protein kinase n=1 Tax=Yinghuangia seranimata TaxID=408067 RepID=UPI00248C57C3|nr:serine/threonine-protein kinase [Yinghuangia seranimata]MDI2127612.1 serine/threonine-protein kinase [Yinghuangia seranimata]
MEQLRPGDPHAIGAYQLEAVLGAGGMGEVFLGRSPGGRRVAIKVVRPDFAAAAEFRRRFAQEVEAARRVGGFWTAPVVDADPEAVRPWVATAYFDAPDLTTVINRAGPLDEQHVGELGAGLAEALASIHKVGLVHRDLKPSNILITDDGPRIIDFGIAKAVEGTALTAKGTVIGTPGFMAPEQVTGGTVTEASDVFSLGAVLTYAAAGHGPFGEGSAHVLLYRVVHDEPDLREVPAGLRSALAACLSKHPQQRPTTDKLLHLLTGTQTPRWGNPAPPPHPTALATAATVNAAVPDSASNSGRLMGWRPSRRAVLAAGVSALAAAAVPVVMELATSSSQDPRRGNAGGTPSPANSGGTIAPPVDIAVNNGVVRGVAFSPDGSMLAVSGGYTITLWDPSTHRVLFPLTGHLAIAGPVRFSPDGKILVCVNAGDVGLWDPVARTYITTLADTGSAKAVAFHPDSTGLALAGEDGTITRWTISTRSRLDALPSAFAASARPPAANAVAWNASGSIVAAGYADNTVRVWELARPGSPPETFASHTDPVTCLAFSPVAPSLLVSGSSDHTVKMWGPGVTSPLDATCTGHTGAVRSLAFSPMGDTLASASDDGTVRLWDPVNHKNVAVLTGHTGPVNAVAFSPDGKTLASAGYDAVKLWTIK